MVWAVGLGGHGGDALVVGPALSGFLGARVSPRVALGYIGQLTLGFVNKRRAQAHHLGISGIADQRRSFGYQIGAGIRHSFEHDTWEDFDGERQEFIDRWTQFSLYLGLVWWIPPSTRFSGRIAPFATITPTMSFPYFWFSGGLAFEIGQFPRVTPRDG